MNSAPLSSRRSAVPNALVGALLVAAFVGFADATYLTAKHVLGTPLACLVFAGCEKVTTSRYAFVFGIPLAAYGAAYYLAILLALVAYLDTRHATVLRAAAAFTAVGFLASVYFVYLQLFVIHAICPYCMLSAAASTTLFVLGVFVLRRTV